MLTLSSAEELSRLDPSVGPFALSHPVRVPEASDLAELFAPRPRLCNKGTWGSVALIGGSLPYSGAIRLAAMSAAALRSGAGLARIGAPRSLCPLLVPAILESTLFPLPEEGDHLRFSEAEFGALLRGTRAAAFGMGAGLNAETEKAVSWLLTACPGTLILDADALNALASLGPGLLRGAACPVILTPHPGEFSRLTGIPIPKLLEDPLPPAEAFAREHGVILLLKGACTAVTDGAETFLVLRGCAGMATAGSGDVLSGILAALCAWGGPRPPLFLAAAAAWLNGRAGELAQAAVGDIPQVAGDTAAALPAAIREIRSSGPLS